MLTWQGGKFESFGLLRHYEGMRSFWIFLAALIATPVLADEALIKAGQKAAIFNCGRCHVVPGGNPFGSIGSTPSFRVMRNYDDWKERFEAFYTEPPHIAITQIEGITDDFDPARPSPIAPMMLTEADVEAILAFTETIEPKDVGTME